MKKQLLLCLILLSNIVFADNPEKFLGVRELYGIKFAVESYVKQSDKSLNYGNWYSPKWQADSTVLQVPIDSLDAIAQKHNFAYQVAEQQGKIYGALEEKRLKAIADYLAVRDAKALPENPKDWKKSPTDINKALRYRDRMITGLAYEAADNQELAWAVSPIEQWKLAKTHQINVDDLEKQVLSIQDNWLKKVTPTSNPKETPKQ